MFFTYFSVPLLHRSVPGENQSYGSTHIPPFAASSFIPRRYGTARTVSRVILSNKSVFPRLLHSTSISPTGFTYLLQMHYSPPILLIPLLTTFLHSSFIISSYTQRHVMPLHSILFLRPHEPLHPRPSVYVSNSTICLHFCVSI